MSKLVLFLVAGSNRLNEPEDACVNVFFALLFRIPFSVATSVCNLRVFQGYP